MRALSFRNIRLEEDDAMPLDERDGNRLGGLGILYASGLDPRGFTRARLEDLLPTGGRKVEVA